jgi:hypothetical protein
VFQALCQQVIAQQLTPECLTELRALLRELEQILMLQLHLEQHFQRQQPADVSFVNQLR